MNTPTAKGLAATVHHYLDESRGQYLPRDFAQSIVRDCISDPTRPREKLLADLDYLARGPGGCLDKDETLAEGETERGEFYWDTWSDVCDRAILTCPINGNKFTLHQDGSLFLIPEGWEWSDEEQTHVPPESDTLRRYDLPSCWASYLVNGDDSGIEDSDKQAADQFVAKEGLQGWCGPDVSERTWFARSNDATRIGGDVARYTWVLISNSKTEGTK